MAYEWLEIVGNAPPEGGAPIARLDLDTGVFTFLVNTRFRDTPSASLALNPKRSATTISVAEDETYTAEQVAGGIIVRDGNGAARTDTLPDAEDIIESCHLDADGDYAELMVVNITASNNIDVVGGTGVTMSIPLGTAVAAQESKIFLILRTSATTVTVYG